MAEKFNVSFSEFKKDPLMYILFVPLLVVGILFYKFTDSVEKRTKDRDKEFERVYKREERTDSINHVLYELNGVRRALDSLKH